MPSENGRERVHTNRCCLVGGRPLTLDWLAQARAKREMAARARRLADGLTSAVDRDSLILKALELEAEAAELELRKC